MNITATNLEICDPHQLVQQLGAAEWTTQKAAADTLEAQGTAALDALIKGLSHENAQVRAACAALMDHLADERCALPLKRALTDESAQVRRHAVHSLGCQQCKIAPLPLDVVGLLIERVSNDSSIRVRRVAVHQLGLQPSDPRAIAALQTILQESNDEKLLSRARFALLKQQEN